MRSASGRIWPLLTFPPPPGCSTPAVWTGAGFAIGDARVPVLSYQEGPAAWSDELTRIHEETAGEDHYIDRASRSHAAAQLRRWLRAPDPLVMDIGCSSGFLLRLLRNRFPHFRLAGADFVRGPLERLAQAMPDIPLLQFDLAACPLPAETCDAVVLLNVLEHIRDDDAALAHTRRILKPGGIAVIEVPAGPALYDVYDRQLLHLRRYRMRDLAAKARAAGFDILDRSHLGFFLYPPFRLVKRRNRRYLNAPEDVRQQIVERSIRRSSTSPLLHALMRFELALGRLLSYPYGIRCLLTCRRP